eukprot:CAMPEP_0179328440 /NCGR_PEP_ID=MMETSP0797-20121207/62525_1 /TAXON_ID=47934 /ORGANISM="Dinophysis acuminata, Strain DAEP01" /LENGTH=429 /DNA_ID=CAMNT_0021040889 /DNA_START=14 /DNA_END=1300 /DNA_ORIENTATION=-
MAQPCVVAQWMPGALDVQMCEEDELRRQTLWHRFAQRRLKAWQPILTPRWMIASHITCGIAFLGLGIGLLIASRGIVEHVHDYTDEAVDGSTRVGSIEFELDSDMESPILIYYQLEGFHQNHRRYVKSRDDDQLRGVDGPKLTEAELSTCSPAISSGGRVNYPCGLIAKSVFNDKFLILEKRPGSSDWQKLPVKSDAKTIAWPSDTQGKFRNLNPEERGAQGEEHQVSLNMWLIREFPPVACEQRVVDDAHPWNPADVALRNESRQGPQDGNVEPMPVEVVDCKGHTSSNPTCNFVRDGRPFSCEGNYELAPAPDWGIENGHFIVWMRIAGLPTFRKLWGKVSLDEPIRKGTRLRVYFKDNFEVKKYNGRKAIVIGTTSALGGQNDFLGYGYIVLGCWCLLFGTFFVFKKTRHLGDISLLFNNPEVELR